MHKPARYFLPGLLACLGTLYLAAQPVRQLRIGELETIISQSKHPLVVSFWATFCLPCLKEIPALQEMADRRNEDSIELLLVSLDLRDDYPKLASFIQRHGISARVAWLNETNADYFCPRIDSAWSGSIPATLFVNRTTSYRRFYERALSQAEIEQEFMAIRKTN